MRCVSIDEMWYEQEDEARRVEEKKEGRK